ncbi:MAG: transcriptional repressor LexA [Gammaproteobacteria bacterium]
MPKSPAGKTRAAVREFVCQRILLGEPPSVREIQEKFGFRSTATAREHLHALVEAGELEHEPGRDRGYRIPGAFMPGLAPILGRVQAGSLTEAIEVAEGYVPVRAGEADEVFALKVVGESMAGREIHEGDVVLVRPGARIRQGDVVVALVGEDATVKTYTRRDNQIVLMAENPDYPDIVPARDGPEFRIVGRVFEVRRQL